MSLDSLGATEIGIDIATAIGPMLEAAGGLTSGIINTVKQAQDEKKLAADQATKLKSALAADISAASALAKAAVSAQAKAPSAAMDQKAADLAVSAQQTAAGKLSADANEVRAAAAQTAQTQAIGQAQAAPKDAYKAALVDAWTTIVNKANNAAIVSKSPEGGAAAQSGGESFLTKKVIGPVPVWGAGLGVVGLGLLAKKFLGK
jgi:hypothetical protein